MRMKFYSVPTFGKLLATLANPVAGPQSKRCAVRRISFLPKSPKKKQIPFGNDQQTLLFPI